MKIKVFTAFAGYDSQCMALDKAGIEYELIGWSEIDKYAIQAHNALFPQYQNRNYGDIKKIDWDKVPDFDLFTYSSPCQDFSRAGHMKGGDEDSGTRSSLLWECRKAIQTKRPKYLILENVRDLVSRRFYPLFCEWLKELEGMGYENNWKVVNAIDNNCPQNRQRVILVSIRKFNFPAAVDLDDSLDSIFDTDVSPDYYVAADQVGCICEEQPKQDYLRIRQATRLGYIEVKRGGVFDSTFPNSKTRRGRVQGNAGDICPTLTASASNCILRFEGYKDGKPVVRKLTEREIFRLMGVSDDQIDTMQSANIGARQQRKLAGNSICVNVLQNVFSEIFN